MKDFDQINVPGKIDYTTFFDKNISYKLFSNTYFMEITFNIVVFHDVFKLISLHDNRTLPVKNDCKKII